MRDCKKPVKWKYCHIAAKLKRPSYITAGCEIVKVRLARGIVHFCITSLIAKNNIFVSAPSMGKPDLFFVTLRSCRLIPSSVFVV